jgi:diguanylate cyclase (GGDEF)-like protein/PAS domain S-box-containing protein
MAIHSRLQQQLREATNRNDTAPGEALLELVSSTYEELDQQLTALNSSSITDNDHLQLGLEEFLEAIQCGIVLVNSNGTVHHCNNAAIEILGLKAKSSRKAFNKKQVLPKLHGLKLTGNSDRSVAEIEVAPGKLVSVHARRTSSGMIVTLREAEPAATARNASFMAAEEYRSLFENATCGIYRDRVDGTPVRCNPALVKFNGYNSEAEYRKSVSHADVSWYVAPNRSAQFHQMMKTEGCVKDFVSEVYRHRTREKVWITENAWYVRDENGVPIYIEGTIQDASERISTIAIVEQQANLDALTGLASRRRFLKTLEDKIRDGNSSFTVYSLDLDRFKPINDIYGHATGDLVLQTLARRLQSLLREDDLVARLGGDEFAILQSDVVSQAGVTELAMRIVDEMKTPLWVQGHHLLVGSSVGIATFPAQGTDAAALLGNADLALYKAKKSGGNSFCIFNAELRSGLQHRLNVEEELKSAVSQNQLELYYQPIVASATGAIHGYEALMRWHHPIRGMLPPSEFIQIAEDTGLMAELGNWAIKCACQHAAALPSEIKISVNVSASQFRSASILEVLRSSLDETGLDPDRLILEITESVILANEAIADTIHSDLRAMGVLLALDDFGTGYSSLSYLQRFRFDEVKIDRSFVNGMAEIPANLAIVRAIIGIGQDLGINIVAEGVETELQADKLIAEGCTLLQGYLYGKPKPYSEAVNDLGIRRLRIHKAVAQAAQTPAAARG